MKLEKENLIHDLLDPEHDERRAEAFLAGGRALRRRRWRRRGWQIFAAALLLGAGVTVSFNRTPYPEARWLSLVPAPAKPAESLSDEELLALFPGTPVGLATMADGKKRLVFPRPGDEERFVSHL